MISQSRKRTVIVNPVAIQDSPITSYFPFDGGRTISFEPIAGEGHRFSWRMKLIDRDARAQFYVINPNDGETLEVDPDAILSPHQTWKMAARPDMILQFAHYLARTIPFYGTKPLRVEARVLVSLNGRKPALLVDQNVSLPNHGP